jgi:CubicO group peptidase (beta-lactamase class C family)
MTKGITALATLLLVDRGLLDPDTTAISVLPEFERIKVLEAMGPDGPVLREARRPVTLRHLMTHTSGFAYDTWCRPQLEYQEYTGMPHIMAGTLESMYYPLQFDPGDGFGYGIGYDWVGRMIERVDGRRIDQFCQQEIFEPLGLTDTVFDIEGRGDRLADLLARGEDGQFAPMDLAFPPEPEFYGMGGCLHGTAPEYLRFLRLVLNRGELDGRRLVSEHTMNLMLENQMGQASVPRMVTVVPWLSADVEFFPGYRKTHTLGFFRNEEDIPGMRSVGSLTWAGAGNTHYWVDPAKDIAAVLMTQTFPFCEPRFMAFYEEFEQAVYREFRAS